MTETETATAIANIVLDRPYEDPDGDKAILSRQFLRSQERVTALEAEATLLGASLTSMRRQIEGQEVEIARLRQVLDGIMIGGNHLANILIQRVGPDFSLEYPPDMDTWKALEKLHSWHDVWVAWAAIMRARSALPGSQERARMTRDELIEAMEAAILASDTCHATSALAAIEAAGYAVVPVEPSPAMVDAGGSVVSMGQIDPMHINDRWHGPEGWTMHEQEQGMLLQGRLSGSVRIYQAMLAASPLKQGEGE